MKPSSALLFAAGFGTRMRHLTQDRPKPMIKVAGRPLIDHTIDLLKAAQVPTLVANLHYKPDQLAAHLAPLGVQTVIERPDILETGGGLRNALPLLGAGPVITANTDAIWIGPNPVQALLEAWDAARMDALLMCVPVAQTRGYTGTGDFARGADGSVSRGDGLVYGGVQIIKTDLLADIPDRSFSLNLLWDRMLAKGTVHALAHRGTWCDVGHPGGITTAEQMLEQADV